MQIRQAGLERINADLRCGQLEARWAAQFDTAPAACFALDAQGHIVEANRAGAALLGLEGPQPVIGLRIRTQTHRLRKGLGAAATGTTN